MTGLVLIDTSAWVQALRRSGDPDVRKRVSVLLSDRRAAWCEMVRLELWSGVGKDHERRDLLRLDEALPRVPITSEVWQDAARLASRSGARGFQFPASDLVIYACAKRHRLSLEHVDRHYHQMAAL